MGKTIEIRKALFEKLRTISPDVFYGTAKASQSPVFIVFLLDSIQGGDGVDAANLEINVSAAGGINTSDLEDISDAVQDGMDHWSYFNELSGVGFTSYFSSRISLIEEESNTQRRRLSFELRIYGG